MDIKKGDKFIKMNRNGTKNYDSVITVERADIHYVAYSVKALNQRFIKDIKERNDFEAYMHKGNYIQYTDAVHITKASTGLFDYTPNEPFKSPPICSVAEPVQPKSCNCPMNTIMARGCLCGAIERYKS